jgi:DNA-directed RNA polymerase specialized sigma24 family protein
MLHKLLSPHRKRRSIEAAICSRIAHRLANWADSQSLFGPRRDKNQRLRREDWFDLFDEPQAVEIDNKTEPIAHGDGAAGNYVDSLDEALIDCKSKREVEAMRLASKGLSLREIGKALRVSHQTAMRLLDRIAARRTKRLMQADGLS